MHTKSIFAKRWKPRVLGEVDQREVKKVRRRHSSGNLTEYFGAFCCLDGYFRAYLARRWRHKSAQSGNDVRGMTVVSTERNGKVAYDRLIEDKQRQPNWEGMHRIY